MPEMYLKQPGFTYSTSGPFTKNKESIRKFKATKDTNYIYKNELDKACFQHDMASGEFKDLERRTASDTVLRYKEFNIAKDPKYAGYQRSLPTMVYKFFDKKSAGTSTHTNSKIKQNHQLAAELHKTIIKIFQKRTVYSGFKDNIWGADLDDMQLISKFNKGFRFLLRAIDVFSKYAWIAPLKDKKGISIVNAFQKILDDSARKPNKICVDKGRGFYNSSFKK